MIVQQLGNGGAFDYDKTNSSFLIDIGTSEKRSLILFDCGYNVFAKLRELEKEDKDIIKDIEHIWISHLDDDHVGSLKSLIYYRYFIHGLTSAILKNDLEKSFMYFLSDINQTMSFGRLEKTDIVFTCNKDILKNGIYSYKIEPVKTFHHLECNGLMIKEMYYQDVKSILYISGDTKVCKGTLEALNDIYSQTFKIGINHKTYKIFHDYSNWNSYENNVHTCKYDFDKYYLNDSKLKNLEITKYHNNEQFIEEWQEI